MSTIPEELSHLIRSALAVDGQPPFSDQSLLDLSRGERRLIELRGDIAASSGTRGGTELLGAAVVSTDEGELVIAPDVRRKGNGAALAAMALLEAPGLTFAWAHGDHPGARALAANNAFTAVRTLLQLRAPVPAPTTLPVLTLSSTGASAMTLSAFRPGVDDAQWLAINALAFAGHPEQGKMTQRDLNDRTAQEWFAPDDFLLLRDADGTLIAFCWMKVEDGVGEFYAVGVDPGRHGQGLGRVLMQAGFTRLAEQGIEVASLYVEADNAPALSLYRRFGFEKHTIDVQYQATDTLTVQ